MVVGAAASAGFSAAGVVSIDSVFGFSSAAGVAALSAAAAGVEVDAAGVGSAAGGAAGFG